MRARIQTTLLASVMLVLAAPVTALDVTGSWEGKFKCKAYDGEKYPDVDTSDTLQISQDTGILRTDDNFSGFAVPDSRKPDTKGEVALAHCETSTDPSARAELARLKAKVNRDKGKGKLKGTSIYTVGGLQVGTCRWSYKLVDTADPGAPGCGN